MAHETPPALLSLLETSEIQSKYNLQTYANGTITLTLKSGNTANEDDLLPVGDRGEEEWRTMKIPFIGDQLIEMEGYEISNYGRFKRPGKQEPHYLTYVNHNGAPTLNIRSRNYTVISLVAANFLKRSVNAGRVSYVDRSNPMNTHVSNVRYVTSGIQPMHKAMKNATAEQIAEIHQNLADEVWRCGPYTDRLFHVPAHMYVSNYGRIKHGEYAEPEIVTRLDSSGAPYLSIAGRNVRLIRLVAALHIPKPYPECDKVKYINSHKKMDVSVNNVAWIVTTSLAMKYAEKQVKPTQDNTLFVPDDEQIIDDIEEETQEDEES